MNLSGQQWKQLQEALLDAFPDKSLLEQMLLFGLDKHLDAIVEGGSLEKIVFSLIKTALAQGWLVDLVRAAYNSNPGNLSLKIVADELLINPFQDIDTLVQEIREKIKPYIKERCGTIRVLDMAQPVILRKIHTEVNIKEKITRGSQDRYKEVLGLQAIEQHGKLTVLGKPGAGKTTFLKYLAIQCIEGQFQSDRIPIFITLKYFAEESKQLDIVEHIARELSECKVKDTPVKTKQLLEQGKVLVLLDGLDEVREKDNSRIIRKIENFSQQFCDNKIIITCRKAATNYIFEKFVDVEVADFNNGQIETFANQWFNYRKSGKAEKFIQELEKNQPIKKLATNPLLLTLLCLIFEKQGEFKNNRSELYEEMINLLLNKWDDSRNIKRKAIYKNLSTKGKKKLLSKIAFSMFQKEKYRFNNRDVEHLISDYIYNLSDAKTNSKYFFVDTEKILEEIEAQHGLLVEKDNKYSFSHLIFQEYLTAWEIEEESAYEGLVARFIENDKRWQEVFFLTAEMMQNADVLFLLMKDKIDGILSIDENLHNFLEWINQKSHSVKACYKPAAIRGFYFALEQRLIIKGNEQNQNVYQSDMLVQQFQLASKIDKFLEYSLTLELDIDYAQELALDIEDLENSWDYQEHESLVYEWGDIDLSQIENNDIVETTQFKSSEVPQETDIEQMRFELSEVTKRIEDSSRKMDREMQYDLDIAEYIIASFYQRRLYANDVLKTVIENLSLQLKEQFRILVQSMHNRDKNIDDSFQEWWNNNYKIWFKQLKKILLIQHRNIGHDWQFNDAQKQLLQQYYDANMLLVDCLKSDCYVSREVRQQIEDTLLLPTNTTGDRTSNA
ncbi:NACHT domain-containing protein [Scytonema sp. UIC 10036]|uniref:NACHT C-terminal helical domain 2-containing protein n=1 Tax=Scytonema sp. UIC 10036 TaxID=2304196 RepID=UPI0012DA9084|nr:effector-associated domain EAD1-containing protein [Scytonema sp. UIC 10036]MUG92830.1 NACHT domain-containing protein [Scytonema sp. UIC 10036]